MHSVARLPLFAGILCLVSVAGCGGIGMPPLNMNSVDPLNVSPSTLTFTTPTPNTTSQQTMSVQNTGSSSITVQSISVSGSSAFSVKASLPQSLQPGQSFDVGIAFDPSIGGSFSGSLDIAASPAHVRRVPISGKVSGTVSVSISPTQPVLQVGSSQQFTANVTGTNNTGVTWDVNGVPNGNATYGTISSSGMYTAPATVPAGGAISVTAVSAADPSKSASASVTVVAAVSAVTVTISPTTANLQSNSTQQFAAQVAGTSNTGVTWYVNGVLNGNATYGTISSSGMYTAPATVPAGGAISVTAVSTADSSKSASASVTVIAAVSPVTITISPVTASLQSNLTQQFTAQVAGTSNTGVTWYVNGVLNGNATYGTISSSGTYTAPASVPSGGAVSVTATSMADTSKSASASVTIVAAPSTVTVTISPTSTSVQGNLTQQFSATVSGTSNTAVNWLVHGTVGGDTTYGTISSSGVYRAPACPAVSGVTVTAQSYYAPTVSASATVSLTPAPPNSTDRYVATNGSDSSDGSACKPWATINHAASMAGPGTTVHVASGTYNQSVGTSNSGSSSAPIRYVSDVRWGAQLIGTDDSVWLNSGSYVTIEGFDISAANTTPRQGILSYGQYVKIIGNRVHDIAATSGVSGSGGAGISPNNNGSVNSDYTVVDSNVVYNIADAYRPNYHVHGIYVNGSAYVTVSNNLVINTSGWGIEQDHPGVGYMTAVNNTIVNTDGGVMVGNTSGGAPSDYNFIANNIVVHNTAYYAYEDCCASSNVGGHNTYTHNLSYDVGGYGNYQLYYGSPVSAITGNPMFINNLLDYNGDYHLQTSSSPAVNAGTSTNAPPNDNDIGARPVGGAWDIGAYEFGTTPGTWPWQ